MNRDPGKETEALKIYRQALKTEERPLKYIDSGVATISSSLKL